MSLPSGSRTYSVDPATVRQKRTGRPVRFELTDQIRQAVDAYLKTAPRCPGSSTGLGGVSRCMTTRQCARLLSEWIASIGLDPHLFSTHSLRRESLGRRRCGQKGDADHRRTENLRAVQLLLGHTYQDRKHRQYLGIEVDDALSIAE